MRQPLTIKERLEAVKAKTGWSDARLASQLNVSPASVTGWRGGKIQPRPGVVKRLEILERDLDGAPVRDAANLSEDGTRYVQMLLDILQSSQERPKRIATGTIELCYELVHGENQASRKPEREGRTIRLGVAVVGRGRSAVFKNG